MIISTGNRQVDVVRNHRGFFCEDEDPFTETRILLQKRWSFYRNEDPFTKTRILLQKRGSFYGNEDPFTETRILLRKRGSFYGNEDPFTETRIFLLKRGSFYRSVDPFYRNEDPFTETRILLQKRRSLYGNEHPSWEQGSYPQQFWSLDWYECPFAKSLREISSHKSVLILISGGGVVFKVILSTCLSFCMSRESQVKGVLAPLGFIRIIK